MTTLGIKSTCSWPKIDPVNLGDGAYFISELGNEEWKAPDPVQDR